MSWPWCEFIKRQQSYEMNNILLVPRGLLPYGSQPETQQEEGSSENTTLSLNDCRLNCPNRPESTMKSINLFNSIPF